MFGIDSAKDKLKQLEENFKRLIKDASNVSLAEQVCHDAWHLNDWHFQELKDLGNPITLENNYISNVLNSRFYMTFQTQLNTRNLVPQRLRYKTQKSMKEPLIILLIAHLIFLI
jgi:hypothetical protein